MAKSAAVKAANPEMRDGRRERSDASRRKIVDAMLELAREGEPAPSADAVAERAGVGRRTVFRLFKDMESLYREMHATMIERIEHIRALEIEGESWRERFACLVDRRVRLFEEIMPIEAAANVHRHQSEFLRNAHATTSAMLRDIMMFVLPKAAKADADLVEALDTAMSIEAWRRLRWGQGLSAKAARRVVERTANALLADVK
ncbi:MAG: TetR family transcriptional regulator [Terricaulis sp.]